MAEAVWLLTSRGRPELCQEVLDACEETGMTSRGLLYVDETVEDYEGIRLPSNWRKHAEPEWGSIAASLRYALKRFPKASQYGWLADDTFPRTEGWDTALEEAAGDWYLACARDLFTSDRWPDSVLAGYDLTAGLCWGGELIRAVGWWSPPGLIQAGIDTTWAKIVRDLSLNIYLASVTVEHKNYRTGKREFDAGDEWTRQDAPDYVQHDIATANIFQQGPELQEALGRIREGMHATKHR